LNQVPELIFRWFSQKGFSPFPFQVETWQAMLEGKSGLLNAPTGSGKTFAIWMGVLSNWLKNTKKSKKGIIKVLYVSPLRSLSKDLFQTLQQATAEICPEYSIGMRTGDTPTSERSKQKNAMPDALVTTPESLHILLSQKNSTHLFDEVDFVIVDEWHDLLGSKRGIQMELAISRIKGLQKRHGKENPLVVWGISATIPNLNQAFEVLTGGPFQAGKHVLVKADIKKEIRVDTVFPDTTEKFPWAGRLGLPMVEKVLEIVRRSESSLVFTNTRAQTEIWYQNILLLAPELAGSMAIHHSSLDQEIRLWVEDSLKLGKLKLVVCTSSLDLGVDFAPVETIVQIGSPKDVSRIMQRAGRSGHSPGKPSQVYFVPTYGMELIDAAALKQAVKERKIEQKNPLLKPMDVLVQYLVSLAVGDGFVAEEVLEELLSTFAYRTLTEKEWNWAIRFITLGGDSLQAYDDFQKVVRVGDKFVVTNKRIATRHRLSMGTIVGNVSLKIKFISGGYVGTVEEIFFSKMKEGDVFWFGGRALEFIRIKDMTVLVRKATKGKGSTPAWAGGRMPLSSTFADFLRLKIHEMASGNVIEPELVLLQPMIDIQQAWSAIPNQNEFLVEYMESRDGFHLVFYPFEGRAMHEILAALIAYRISLHMSITFTIGMNDYGFELLSDQALDVEELLSLDLFSVQNLEQDMLSSINEAEMARRHFRDIAAIAGLVFQGYPGKKQSSKHLQSSSQLIFDVFQQYEPDNLLFRQAHDEVLDFQVENSRLVNILNRISKQKILLKKPPRITPFAFPILVDVLRGKLSSETLEDRIMKMTVQLEKYASGGTPNSIKKKSDSKP
jgi:ATP-dependent Lhr-like helicase